MGLACSQVTLLTLTARKADCEYGISIDSARKMALTREMSELSNEYYSKLKCKQYAYYADGKYNQLNYNYLMGGMDYTAITAGTSRVKRNFGMVLTDYRGQVVMSDEYANAIVSVLGKSVLDANGRGGQFDKSKIPEMITKLTNIGNDALEDFKTVMNGGTATGSYDTTLLDTLTTDYIGSHQRDNSDKKTAFIQKLLDYYLPIFEAAATNGWTVEYNTGIQDEQDGEQYLNDHLVTGTLQLAKVNDNGHYEEDTSISYFVTAGFIDTNNSAETREEITAWYNREKDLITEKENYLDVHMGDLSTELEAINTEIQSIQSFIDDAISSVFDWGTS